MIDIVVILIAIKCIALIVEDVIAAARGKTSPRRQERERRDRADRAAGREPKRTRSAIGKYLADLVEDASDAARESRPERWEQRRKRREERRIYRQRRKQGPVAIEFDQQAKHWYGICDLCGWRSRPYQLRRNADDAAKRHAEAQHRGADQQQPPSPPESEPPRPTRTTANRKPRRRSDDQRQLQPVPELESNPPQINEGS
jgi:hypothetical protein